MVNAGYTGLQKAVLFMKSSGKNIWPKKLAGLSLPSLKKHDAYTAPVVVASAKTARSSKG